MLMIWSSEYNFMYVTGEQSTFINPVRDTIEYCSRAIECDSFVVYKVRYIKIILHDIGLFMTIVNKLEILSF
jgi:hypothetical protein